MRIKTVLASLLLAGCQSFGTQECMISPTAKTNAEKLASYVKEQGLQEKNRHSCRYMLDINADGTNYIVHVEEPVRTSYRENNMLSILNSDGFVIDYNIDGKVDIPNDQNRGVQQWYETALEKLVENCR